MIGSFFKYLVIGIVALFALKLAFGLAMGLLGLVIGAIPLVIIGYVVYKVVAPKPSGRQISDSDRKWLDS